MKESLISGAHALRIDRLWDGAEGVRGGGHVHHPRGGLALRRVCVVVHRMCSLTTECVLLL